ncbi:SLAC1 anion channel family protein [Pelagimonas varians]|uniref:Tellurite resistance protein TehA n=1 Tax=Pelagimonas varians TaxID=696760 RepID=A0A238KVA7_9RHOB|nr:SLAC1 anion channel family protein [Pelagimonas varians]PYG28345.1 tellurite resistance protein [Pelagimonas varians]SMX46541.1 Tellurite resistance protein TehA [Pelagimonas varians]
MTDIPATPADSRLQHLPVTLFATVMGMAGLTLALHMAETQLGWRHFASTLSLWATIADFVLIAGLFSLKAGRFPKAIAEEWNHPVKLAFFPAISISLLLIATAMRADMPELARMVWVVGAIGQAGLTLAVISGWIGRKPFQPVHISPAWFIPAVGNVVAPIAGVSFGFVELSWLFFATGMLFWIVLLTLVMNRLIFHDPLPGRLLPTLGILIAPPAVGLLAWLQLNGGQLDAFARVLFYAAITFTAIVTVQAPGFAKLPFALSFWALSFPAASLTVATFRYGTLAGSPFHTSLAFVFLAVLIAIVAALIFRTTLAAMKGQICMPE